MPSPPRATVVVPVRNRRVLLTSLLDALDAQTGDDFEVIVVDDGSTDGSGAAAAGRTIRGRPVRVVAGAGTGAVAARTLGVSQAAGEILAFTDSDCEPVPAWLHALTGAIDEGADLAHGPTVPARAMRPLERSVWAGDEGLYPSCNVAFRRQAFDAAGGFDPTAAARLGFRAGGRARRLGFGEDTLLAWRVRQAGSVAYVPDAVVRHHVFPPDPLDTLSRQWMAGAFPALVREVPELRRSLLERRLFLGLDRVPMYATAAGALGRARWPTAVAGAWWVGSRLHRLRRSEGSWAERLAALPIELAGDAIVGAALVVGSIRAGRLVL